jgi:hypothetical protein
MHADLPSSHAFNLRMNSCGDLDDSSEGARGFTGSGWTKSRPETISSSALSFHGGVTARQRATQPSNDPTEFDTLPFSKGRR